MLPLNNLVNSQALATECPSVVLQSFAGHYGSQQYPPGGSIRTSMFTTKLRSSRANTGRLQQEPWRRLAYMIHSVWTREQPYDPNYKWRPPGSVDSTPSPVIKVQFVISLLTFHSISFFVLSINST
jgi:hypothetical protein